MATFERRLTATEAAVVAGVTLRDVNRLLDRDILPKALTTKGDGERRVAWLGCPLIRFYVLSAPDLTSATRRFVIRVAFDRLRRHVVIDRPIVESGELNVEHGAITVALRAYFDAAADQLEQLAEAEALVEQDSDVLGGVPVFRGTRIPVYDIAGALEEGESRKDLLHGYPRLTDRALDLALIYARAHPMRGRPPKLSERLQATPVSSAPGPRK